MVPEQLEDIAVQEMKYAEKIARPLVPGEKPTVKPAPAPLERTLGNGQAGY